MSLPTRCLRFLLLAGLITLCSGCGGPSAQQEVDFQSEFKLVSEMFDLLDTVKDDKSAEAMKPRLDDLYQRIQAMDGKLGKLPEETRKKLYERNKDLVEEANGKIAKQVSRQITGDLPQEMSQYLFVIAKERKS